MPEQIKLCEGLDISAKVIHQNNVDKGFWDEERNVGELLMLVVSELAEAMEAHRGRRGNNEKEGIESFKELIISGNNWEDNADSLKLAYQDFIKGGFAEEIADAVIRLLDLSAGLGIDLEWHIQQKVAYNKTREKLHGKKY
jgi:NTP pyrophosphatase (non-canonical NTP hydrolase)